MVSLAILGSPDLLNYWIFIIERTLIHTEQFLFILGCSVEWLPWRTCVQLHSLPIHSSWQCSKRSNSSQCPFVKSAFKSYIEIRAFCDNVYSLSWYYQSIFLAQRLKIACLSLNFKLWTAEFTNLYFVISPHCNNHFFKVFHSFNLNSGAGSKGYVYEIVSHFLK